MGVTYTKLKIKLIEQGKQMVDIHNDTGISWTSLTKINKNKYISLRTLEEIAKYLNCDIGDLVEIKK